MIIGELTDGQKMVCLYIMPIHPIILGTVTCREEQRAYKIQEFTFTISDP
jgi:hypothetical protein